MRVSFAASLIASLWCAPVARADVITWLIEVDQAVYQQGETVTWTASVNASDFSGPNFGVAAAQASLTENTGETLTVATPLVGGAYGPVPGAAGAGFLNGFGIAYFSSDTSSTIENSVDPIFTPIATGTFTANVLGPHALTLTPDAGANAFFILETGFPFPDAAVYDSAIGDSVNFNVAAVPEPSSLALMSIAFGAGGAAWRRRRRSASDGATA